MTVASGGELVAEVLDRQRVRFLFTLCGGHISPILVGAQARGIRVIDVRHEATAVFAADAVSRLTGTPGVAVVTAGPGVTNTITAIKNAELAHSPLVLIGGATATLLRGRGALQDIDQMALMRPHVKHARAVTRLRELVPALEQAFAVAQHGVPGPVFVELPIDLLYPEAIVRKMFGAKATADIRSVSDVGLQLYLRYYLARTFAGARHARAVGQPRHEIPTADAQAIHRTARWLRTSKRPLVLVGSQATSRGPDEAARVADALERMGVPTYLSGMARGLLGRAHPLGFRHQRKLALRDADFVLLAGVPCDFRLEYGLQIRRGTTVVSVNRSEALANLNRKPKLAVVADPGDFLTRLSRELPGDRSPWRPWLDRLATRDREREQQIDEQARVPGELLNPLALCRAIDRELADDSVLVVDGGDFVATASYITTPRGPLSWLDPGPFGTLGVGAGFALAAKLCRPEASVWLLYGDGSAGFSLAELDTFVRHRLPIIAVVGNDGAWSQIARDQVELLHDDVGTVLARSDYHHVARGFGARGLRVEREEALPTTLAQARAFAADGHPVLVNALLDKSEFRKGSISM